MLKYVPRGEEALLVDDLDLTQATGFYASRYHENLYQESVSVNRWALYDRRRASINGAADDRYR